MIWPEKNACPDCEDEKCDLSRCGVMLCGRFLIMMRVDIVYISRVKGKKFAGKSKIINFFKTLDTDAAVSETSTPTG